RGVDLAQHRLDLEHLRRGEADVGVVGARRRHQLVEGRVAVEAPPLRGDQGLLFRGGRGESLRQGDRRALVVRADRGAAAQRQGEKQLFQAGFLLLWRATRTKNSGMKMVATKVEASMPPT